MIPRIRALVEAILSADDSAIEDAVIRLSRSRRWLAPLALAVGAMTMLFQGLRLVFQNWRLMLVQLLPAIWIWLAMFDLKLHVLHGHSLRALHGPILIPLVLAITALTVLSFYLNAVMAFAIIGPPPARVRPAMAEARSHLTPILLWGVGFGLALSFASLIVSRWGHPWFGLALGGVVGLMMLAYVSIPARLVGVRRDAPARDKFVAGAVSSVVGAAVCTPPYVISRIGVLMLGSRHLFIPGLFVMTLGITVQAGATSAIKAIKLSATLLSAGAPEAAPERVPVSSTDS